MINTITARSRQLFFFITNVLLILVFLSGCDQQSRVPVNSSDPAFVPSIVAPNKVVSGDSVHFIVNSGDPDQNGTWVWSQTSGTTATLTTGSDGGLSFTAPMVTSSEALVFSVEASIPNAKKTLSVVVQVQPDSVAVNAGNDQRVQPAHSVSLHAEGTTKKADQILTYVWQQLSGTSVILANDNTANPEFTSPTTGGYLEFQITVTDTAGVSASDIVAITVDAPLPIAIYVAKTTVAFSGQTQTLQVKTDDNTVANSYLWQQVSGPTVSLTNNNDGTASFTSPTVTQETLLEFRVTAFDANNAASSAYVEALVHPQPASQPLIIDAGLDQQTPTQSIVDIAATIHQQGTGTLTYAWTQESGPAATIVNASSQTATVTLGSAAGFMVFKLTVSDGTTTAEDTITVEATALSVAVLVQDPKVANSKQIELGDTLHLHAALTNAQLPAAYQWTQVSGPSSVINNATTYEMNVTPTSVGLVNYQVSVTDDLGRTEVAFIDIDVVAKAAVIAPTPAVTSTLAIHTSAGSTLSTNQTYETDTLNANVAFSGEANPPTFLWQQTTAIAGVTLLTPTLSTVSFVAPQVTRDTPISLEVTVDDGVTTRTDQVHFLILDRPITVSPRADIVAYVGKQQTLSASVSGGLPPLTYAWTQTSGPTTTITDDDKPSASFTPSAKGNYTFQLTASDTIANTASALVHANIDAIPSPPSSSSQPMALLTPPPLSFLEGQDASASITIANAVGTPTIVWTVEDDAGTGLTTGNLVNGSQQAVSFTAPTVTAQQTVILKVEVTDSNGTLSRLLNIPILNRDITVTAFPKTLTKGLSETAHMHASLSAPNAKLPNTWAWAETAGASGTLSNQTTANANFIGSTQGQYTFDASVTDALSNTGKDTVTLTVNDDLSITIDKSPGPVKSDFPGSVGDKKVSLHGVATKGSGNYTYAWGLEAWSVGASGGKWSSLSSIADAHKPFEIVGDSDKTSVVVQLRQPVIDKPTGSVYCTRDSGNCTFIKLRATLTVTDTADNHSESATIQVEWKKPPAPVAKITTPPPAGIGCADVKSAPADGSEGYKAYQCAGPAFLCEKLNAPVTCPAGTIPAIHFKNFRGNSPARQISMGCMSVRGNGSINTGGLPTGSSFNCFNEWFKKDSNIDKCLTFQTKNTYINDFSCTICTVGDLSNLDKTDASNTSACATPGPRWIP